MCVFTNRVIGHEEWEYFFFSSILVKTSSRYIIERIDSSRSRHNKTLPHNRNQLANRIERVNKPAGSTSGFCVEIMYKTPPATDLFLTFTLARTCLSVCLYTVCLDLFGYCTVYI